MESIATYIFTDIESSGLYKDSRILELAMVAISKEDLIEFGKNINKKLLPRVLHKYRKLFYPRRIIYQDVVDICGLSNESLHHLSTFSIHDAKAIEGFLYLPGPLAFVAHNGCRFDFPMLRAELEHVSAPFEIFNKIKCIDSLKCIKIIDTEIEEAKLLASMLSNSDNSDSNIENKNLQHNTSISKSETINATESTKVVDIYSTPDTKKNYSPQKPQKSLIQTSISPYNKNVRRKLFKKSYKQVEIYRRHFNEEYEAHCAESDALALLKICAFYGKHFTDWSDLHASSFSDIKPRWSLTSSNTNTQAVS